MTNEAQLRLEAAIVVQVLERALSVPELERSHAVIGASALEAATVLTVEATGGAKIFGDFVNEATTITLLQNQHVTLQSNGTNWFIVDGEPKREQNPGALTAFVSGTEYTPSATRPSLVTLNFTTTSSAGLESKIVVLANGVTLGEVKMTNNAGAETVDYTETRNYGPFLVRAGQTWKATLTNVTSPKYQVQLL